MEKQIMMVVQAAPNTHPGGVHGALLKSLYQKEVGPSFINQLPTANPPKLMIKKRTKYLIFDILRTLKRFDLL